MNRILGTIWFFGFWGMSLLEQVLFGKYVVTDENAWKYALLIILLWYFPVIWLFNKKDN